MRHTQLCLDLILGTSLSSANTLLPGNSVIALFGDSLESHNGYGSNTAASEEHSNWSRGYLNWNRIIDPRGTFVTWYDPVPTGRFNGCNKGVSGNTTTQMVARKTDITDITGVKVVIQGGGTNDINQNDPVATILANHANCLATWKASGIKTILLTPPPRTTSGTDSWASGSAKRLAWFDVCAGMQALADADPQWVQIVRRDLICSNADADRTPKTGYLNADNVHLAPKGGYHVAADPGGLNEKLANWVSPFTGFPVAPVAGDLVSNSTLSGTSGTVSTGCTGVAPTGFRLRRSTGSNITAVGSKETIDGEEYFKIVINRNGLGGSETIALDLGANISSGLPAVGTWIQSFSKVCWNASPAISLIGLQARQQPSTPANMNNVTMRIDSGYLWENAAIKAANSGGLWQSGPPMQLRTGYTSILFNFLITVDNSTSGTDTVWISRLHLIPVANPKPALGF